MFDWFTNKANRRSAGLTRMRAGFGEMLDGGRRAFDMAASVFLEGSDPETIREELFAIDKRINRGERQIRKELVVHASVHGATEFPACLILMSLVKDAERVGDYSKNLFDLAVLVPRGPEGEHRESLEDLKERICGLMTVCGEVFESNDKAEARKLIVEAKEIEDICDEKVQTLVSADDPDKMGPAHVLAYRYFKRVISHVRNVTSSIVQPLHKLDFTSKIVKAEAAAREAQGAK